MTTGRRRSLGPAGVAVVAFVVHATYALAARPNLLPISDAGGYRLLGKHLAEGRGYIRPYDFALAGVSRPTAEFPPGFAALLAVADLVGIESVTGQRLVLAVVGALTAGGVVLLARRWFSETGSVVVGLAAAVHPALFQPGAALLAESLFALAVVAVLLAAVRVAEEPGAGRAVVLGLVGGAAMLVRSEGALLAVLVALPLAVRGRGRDLEGRLRPRVALGLVAGLIVLPGAWAIRNLATFDEPVLVSNNLGSVLSGSNCDATYGGDLVGYWMISDDCFAGFRAEDLARADESVVAAELRDDGLSYASDHLASLPRVAVVRVLRTFQLWEPEQQARLSTFEGRKLATERVTGWIVWATLPLAAIGAAGLARTRSWFDLWLLASPVLLVVVLAAATYGHPRFRIAADIPLLLLAALSARSTIHLAGRGHT